ncbi:ATP-binding protein [Myxococcota bacterium]|nr:ATP-binding protein [Myxococcota bacterium]
MPSPHPPLISRSRHRAEVLGLLDRNPVVGIVGARQVGKTTLAREVASRWEGPVSHFDLEDPEDAARLSEPMLVLRRATGLVILDEVQRLPGLFPALRVLADRPEAPARFLVLGSASPALLQQGSESLAGRVVFHRLGGLSPDEVGVGSLVPLWVRGGFPRSFLAASDSASVEWRRAFVATFLERDLPELGVRIPSPTLRRFWTMLAHYHGQVWNGAEFARSFGISDMTVRRYLDVLSSTFAARLLPPWFENLGKRQVRSPKVYFTDSGLLHSLLGLETLDDVEGHPKVGASWEGFALQVVTERLGARDDECFFWATHAGAELDLLVVRGNRRLGFEFKRTEAPKLTPSMRVARKDLHLDRIFVIHAGEHNFPLAEGVEALALRRVYDELPPW